MTLRINKENLTEVIAGLAKRQSIHDENDVAHECINQPARLASTLLQDVTPQSDDKLKEEKCIYESALDFLSRREHSYVELKNKLLRKTFDPEKIAAVLKQLIAKNLLSDERFCEMFVRSCINKGKGRLYIQEELRKRGINEVLIKQHLDQQTETWLVQIEKVRRKRFGEIIPKDYKERAKQMRFLQYRGFTIEQINKIFKM
jgi:regulatory protein